jgi:hypothetical protein
MKLLEREVFGSRFLVSIISAWIVGDGYCLGVRIKPPSHHRKDDDLRWHIRVYFWWWHLVILVFDR